MKGTYQQTTIIGNLGADPEVRATANGTSVANLNVAVTSYAGKDGQTGERKEHTEWFRCVVWGAQADNAGRYLSKGSKVLLVGEMRTRKWSDQNGQDRYSTDLVANEMQFMGGQQGTGSATQQKQGQQPAQPQGQQPNAPQNGAQAQGNNFDDFDDDK